MPNDRKSVEADCDRVTCALRRGPDELGHSLSQLRLLGRYLHNKPFDPFVEIQFEFVAIPREMASPMTIGTQRNNIHDSVRSMPR